MSRDHIRTRRGAAITAGALLGALVGDRLLRRSSPPGLGKIGRRNGYTYTYATRGSGSARRVSAQGRSADRPESTEDC